uniref:Putative zinc finger, CCHC-type n=1 Tax=Tanacetum cinerariifolium TaxID=118510 RepID=A0A699GJW5_TANCI|nr:putative zinc finger, CCHC-type [Tanacetum cinerariifolium]
MIALIDQEPAQEVKHIWYDVCNCESCLDEAAKVDDDEDLSKKRKSSQQKLKRMYEKGDPIVGLLGEPLRKFDYYVMYQKVEPSQPPSPLHNPPSSPHKPPSTKSTFQFDADEYEENHASQNQNQETPTEFSKSDIKQYFTFDDVTPSKWRERSTKMLTWHNAELQYYATDIVIKRFLTRPQEHLKDLYHSLGEYRQLQIQ